MFFVNPVANESRELIKTGEAFFVHSVPVRIGFVFVVDADKSPMEDAGVGLAYAFDYIKQEESPAKALTFITDVRY